MMLGKGKKAKGMIKRNIMCATLVSAMVFQSVLPFSGAALVRANDVSKPSADATDEYISVLKDDFESYDEGAFHSTKYRSIDEGMNIISDGKGGKVLSTSVDGVNNLKVFQVDCDYLNREMAFDFKYQGEFKRWDGLYIRLASRDGGEKRYYSLCPGFGNDNVLADANLKQSQKTMTAGVWYRCRSILKDNVMQIKVWESAKEEPQNWDMTYNYGALTDSAEDTYMEFMLDSKSGGSNVSLEVDNLEVGAWKTEPLEETEPQYTYFEDNYEAYEPGKATKDNMPAQYTTIEDGYSIVKTDDGKVLQMTTDANTAKRGTALTVLDCDLVDKQVQYDFRFDKDFTGHDGFYIKLHAQPNKNGSDDEYYYSINPNFGSKNIIVSCNTTNLASVSKSIKKETWYTCKSQIHNGKISVKVWPKGEAEPEKWDIDTVLSGFELTEEGTRYKIEYVDRIGANGPVIAQLDNFSIKTWKPIENKEQYDIKVEANPAEAGTVSGGGKYLSGNQVTVSAQPAENYKFVNWTDSTGAEVSKKQDYTFRAEKSETLTANFKEISLEITSFLADGLTQLAEIDADAKTVKLRFASDIDLTNVKPFFYYDPGFTPSVKPYETMDLTSPVSFDGWTITAQQNTVMQQFYVDPETGNDNNSGLSSDAAFRTIQRAQQAVREISEWSGDVIVNLAGKTYTLDETLEFTEEDGADKGYAVLYRGTDPNKTIISGGVPLVGWEKSDDVPGVENVYEIAAPDEVEYSRDLFVGNKKADLAGGNDFVNAFSNRNDYGYTLSPEANEMAQWRNQSDIEFVYDVGWTSNILPVKEIIKNGDTVEVHMKEEPFKNSRIKLNCNPNRPTNILNAFELLDEENEWYFDREARKIYYIPEEGKTPEDLVIVIPTLDKLVEVRGEGSNKVYGLGFKDIGFKYTSYMRPHIDGQIELQASFVFDPDMKQRNDHDNYLKTPGGVSAAYTEGMRVDGCSFSTMAAGGFDYEEGVVGSTVTGSRFEQLGAAAMQIGGVRVRDAQPFSDVTYEQGVLNENAGPDPDRVTEDVYIFSNVVDTVGVSFRGSVGIFVGYVRDCTLANNNLSNIAYSGISAGWGWGIWDQGGRSDHGYYKFDTPTVQERYVIENNNISSCMQRLNDGGAIYTLSNMPGSIIRGNYIHDVPKPYGAIYLDEGTGGMVDISNNVVYNVYRPYFYHRVAHYASREQECQKAQHDNFFSNGMPSNPDDPALKAIEEQSGVVEGYIPPALQEPEKPAPGDENNSKKLLETVLEKAKQHVADGDVDGLVESIQKLFAEAIEEGEAVMAKENASREEILKASMKLTLAIQALDFKAGDKTDLGMALELTEMIDLSKYVAAGQDAYLAAKAEAERVMADGDAMQPEVDEVWRAFVDAMSNLRLKADKTALSDLLDSIKDLDLNKYTEESVKAYNEVLAYALSIMDDETLSEDDQAKVDEAVVKLAAAKEALTEKKDDSNKNSGNNESSGDNSNNGNSENTTIDKGKDAPKTGDTSSLYFPVFGIALGMGTIILLVAVVFKRKRR